MNGMPSDTGSETPTRRSTSIFMPRRRRWRGPDLTYVERSPGFSLWVSTARLGCPQSYRHTGEVRMQRFKVDCRYESSADGEIDFSEDLEAVDKDVAVEIVLDTNTDEHFVVERSEEHTSELQSLMRISYAVLCLKNKI